MPPIFAALSLLPLVTVAALWARSYGPRDLVVYEAGEWPAWSRKGTFLSSAGRIQVRWHRMTLNRDLSVEAGRIKSSRWEHNPGPRMEAGGPQPTWAGRWSGFGLGYGAETQTVTVGLPVPPASTAQATHSWRFVEVAHAWAALACGVPLAAMARSLVRRHRRACRLRDRCCVNCGYDLRMSPGRCPECGVEVSEEAERGAIGFSGGVR